MNMLLMLNLMLILLLTQAESVEETQKETTVEKNEMTKAEGIYLGDNYFLEEITVDGEKHKQLIKIHTPEGTDLEVGKTYKYEYEAVNFSNPPQTSVDKIEEHINLGLMKISKETAKELLSSLDNVKVLYTETEKDMNDNVKDTFEKSEAASYENMEALSKDTVAITYGEGASGLAMKLRVEYEIKAVLEIVE